MLPVNTPVKQSEYALRSKRNFWLAQGQPTQKNRARIALDNALAERGRVVAHLPADISRGVSEGLEVIWDNGQTSKCLAYMVEACELPFMP